MNKITIRHKLFNREHIALQRIFDDTGSDAVINMEDKLTTIENIIIPMITPNTPSTESNWISIEVMSNDDVIGLRKLNITMDKEIPLTKNEAKEFINTLREHGETTS